MSMILVEPAVPPPSMQPPSRLLVEWLGVDGSRWNLNDWPSGVCLANAPVIGLDNPAWEDQAQDRPSGQRFLDARTNPRQVEWPVHVFTDPDAWAAVHTAWRKSFHPRRVGTWRVTTPDGRWRELDLRLTDSGQHGYSRDPLMTGWVTYLMTLVADQPLWRGERVSRVWRQGVPEDFFNGGDFPGFALSDANLLAAASVDNPGDEEAWPVFTVFSEQGAATVDLRVDGGLVRVPVPDGKAVQVDTSPENPTATRGEWITLEDGPARFVADVDGAGQPVDVTPSVSVWDPRPVPPGEEVPIGVELAGVGGVAMELTPLFWRGMP